MRIQKPIVGFAPPVYLCRRASKPFVLDGDLDKAFWADVEFTDDFVDIEGESRPAPRFRTRAKMLWDDENLYIGAVLEGTEIWGHQTERDSVIFHDNDFEIFIDPDSDTHQYFEFEMNARNTVWDLFLTKPYRDRGGPLNGYDIHGLRTAVRIDGRLNDPSADNRRWTAEVVIPFAAVYECASAKRAPRPGEFYRVNFSRVQWKVDIIENRYEKRTDKNGRVLPEDNWVWAPTGVINIHYPELWGFVFFTEGMESYEIPSVEKDKWELRRIYYGLHAFYDAHGRFPDTLEELSREEAAGLRGEGTAAAQMAGRDEPAEDGGRAAEKLRYEHTRHTFELSCESSDGEKELILLADGEVLTRVGTDGNG